MKPKVFIGASTKALPVAEAIQFGLKHDAEAIVWNQYVFRQTQVPIETLTRCLEEFDFAVFVFLPEDAVNRGDEATMVVRDNVLRARVVPGPPWP